MPFKLVTLCGSLRKNSVNRQLLEALPGLAPQGWTFSGLSSLGEIPVYNQDIEDAEGFPKPVQDMCSSIRAADGLVIASPEYNYGVSGVLKNALDWISRVSDQPFDGLPVSIMSASPSPMGGIRAQYPLRKIFVALKADLVPRPEVAVADAYNRFQDGELVHQETRDVISEHLSAFEKVLRRSAK